LIAASDLSALALHIPIEDLLIPPSAYLQDRTLSPDIHAPYTGGRRAFSARQPLPRSYDGKSRLPRVLRETSSFVLLGKNVETEGVFRIPAQAKLKEILREAYDRGQKFIVWKDIDVTLPLPHYPKTENLEEILHEIDQTEAYNVHMAASLIKSWYSELRDPIVPESSYREVTKIFGGSTAEPSLKQLIELISPRSEWSPLPPISRELLVRHLLPLLSAVGARQETNKMTSENLAVCLAPTFVCGSDQLADVKISALIRRILTKAIDVWPDLRESCGVDAETFENDLKAPERIEDYEDPIENGATSRAQSGPVDTRTEFSGITLRDNDAFAEMSDQTTGVVESGDLAPPPLPPRSATISLQGIPPVGNLVLETRPPKVPPRAPTSDPWSMPGSSDGANPSSRGTPPLTGPPRYSTIIGISHETAGDNRLAVVPPRYSTVVATSDDMTESPSAYIGPANGFGPPRRGDWSFDASDTESPDSSVPGPSHVLPSSSVKRKPVSGTSNDASSKDKV
jgi:Rho GTPase-activating protein 1